MIHFSEHHSTITELSKQREAAQVKIMIDWCNLRHPMQCAGTTWNDVVELSCCAIGVALSSLTPPDSPSATVKLSTVSAGELATHLRAGPQILRAALKLYLSSGR